MQTKEEIRLYKREWARKRRALGLPTGGKASAEWWKKYNKAYYAKPEVKKRKARQMRKYRKDPTLSVRFVARDLTNKAIKQGRLVKKPCEKCRVEKTEAHHTDYYKPLEVVWLCRTCHKAEHAKAEGR